MGKSRAGPGADGLNGLIQHSFALRIDKGCQYFRGQNTHALIDERFSRRDSTGAGFRVRPVGDLATKKSMNSLSPHSLLVRRGLTTVQPQGIAFLERSKGQYSTLPSAFSWVNELGEASEARMIFAKEEEDRSLSLNDFLVEEIVCNKEELEAKAVSRVLGQIIAHQRSLLFGLALASRFVNVMLPHALLTPASGSRGGEVSWLLQPLVSLIRTSNGEGDQFRRMYTLTLFVIPVDGFSFGARAMPEAEINDMVNARWSLASSRRPKELSRFDVAGPLREYLSLLDRAHVPTMFQAGNPRSGHEGAHTPESSLTLRQVTETILLAVALRMTQGPTGRMERQARLRVGDHILTSLVSAHVSSVVVVDPDLKRKHLNDPPNGKASKKKRSPKGKQRPGALEKLMKKLAEDTRIPESDSVTRRRRYRLDRAYFDDDCYALGVLPSSRCLVLVSAKDAQRGRKESGLMQAGWVAYMTIGAATAIGTMRAIDLDLEQLKGSDPSKVADIEREVTVGLHEIYDLDITQESFRHLYRLLRKRLGITNDYKALVEKMQALYRETTASHEDEAQARLMWLTAAIVMLSLLILIGTIVLATK
jgi:hypothetical protein